MKDILLGPNGDLKIVNGDLVLIDGADFIRQTWLIKASKYKGEWLLDTNSGMPYIQEIFQKSTSKRAIEQHFRDMTLSIPGVLRVESVEMSKIDAATRRITITVNALIEGPESLTFYYDGALGASTGAEDYADLPLTLGDLRMWFDTSDLAHLSYLPPHACVLSNRAATGAATGYGDLPLIGVSPLGNRRAALLTPVAEQRFEIADTPAIRHVNNGVSIFIVLKYANSEALSPGANEFGLLSLSGIASGDPSFYNVLLSVDGSSDDADFVLESSDGTLTEIASCNMAGTRTDSKLLQVDISTAGEVNMWINNLDRGVLSDMVTVRLLNGQGKAGAALDSNGSSISRFFPGYIGEILVYAEKLSDTDSERVRGYLMEKWLIPTLSNTGFGHGPWGHFPWGHGVLS